jgi:hypothetical protein
MFRPKMNNFPLTGGCNCGAIRFEVTEPLVMASYCPWVKSGRRQPVDRPGDRRRGRQERVPELRGERGVLDLKAP